MNDSPSISVIIPVHNGERYLAEAINSVLAQDYPVFEVLVIDDGSNDRTADIVRSFGTPVHYHFQLQAGAGAARNCGAELARGELLSFLDADDLWEPRKLRHQVYALAEDTGLDIVFGHVQQFICSTIPEPLRARLHCPSEAMPGYHPGTMLLRRETFFSIGRFDTQWQVGEFVDWYARAVENGKKILMVPEVVMKRRLHVTNQGIYKHDHYKQDYLRILKRTLARRQAKNQTL